MTEEFLCHVWKLGLFNSLPLYTIRGEEVTVLNPGSRNEDSGPDFFNAKLKIGEILWAGNVEIHQKTSDWYLHCHQDDRAYDNVILHVVNESVGEVTRSEGEYIQELELKEKVESEAYRKYQQLTGNLSGIACQSQVARVPVQIRDAWVEKLVEQRLERKSMEILEQIKAEGNDTEKVFYEKLSENFGFKKNALPFSMLARVTPLKYLAKQKDHLLQIEAMLFGQAGFLKQHHKGEYFESLRREYEFLRNKYKLEEMDVFLWKYLRLRPSNFPTIRIAQLAAMLHQSTSLLSRVIELKDLNAIRSLFGISASGFWKDHYSFDVPSPSRDKVLGKSSIDNIIINTVVPFVYAWGMRSGNQQFKDFAIDFLVGLPPENNAITRKWKGAGMNCDNALGSQALIELYNSYCDHRKCLDCEIGQFLIGS